MHVCGYVCVHIYVCVYAHVHVVSAVYAHVPVHVNVFAMCLPTLTRIRAPLCVVGPTSGRVRQAEQPTTACSTTLTLASTLSLPDVGVLCRSVCRAVVTTRHVPHEVLCNMPPYTLYLLPLRYTYYPMCHTRCSAICRPIRPAMCHALLYGGLPVACRSDGVRCQSTLH